MCFYCIDALAQEEPFPDRVPLRKTVSMFQKTLKTDTCTNEMATELGVSQKECNKRKKNALAHCEPYVTKEMPEIVSRSNFDLTMQKILFCEMFMLTGCKFSNKFYDEFTKLSTMAKEQQNNKEEIASRMEKLMGSFCPQSLTTE
jgi:hypothetical protein